MRYLTVIPLIVMLGACADLGSDADLASQQGALGATASHTVSLGPSVAIGREPVVVIREAVVLTRQPTGFSRAFLPEAVQPRPDAALRESHQPAGVPHLRPPSVALCADGEPELALTFAGELGDDDSIDAFRLPPCLSSAPSLTDLLPLIIAQYAEDGAWQARAIDRAGVVAGGFASSAQLAAMDSAAHSSGEHVQYFVAGSGDQTLLVAYYPDQGELFGIIVTVGDAE